MRIRSIMSNKRERDTKEMISLFCDPKFERKAWRAVGQAIANSPAKIVSLPLDAKGEISPAHMVEQYSYEQFKADIGSLGNDDREPTELEMIMRCQMVKARFDTGAAVFIRDTLGAKPVDESKVDQTVNNPYEMMTDDELDMLIKYREQKKLAEEQLNEENADDNNGR